MSREMPSNCQMNLQEMMPSSSGHCSSAVSISTASTASSADSTISDGINHGDAGGKSREILVGYAFGKKKLKTMKLIMHRTARVTTTTATATATATQEHFCDASASVVSFDSWSSLADDDASCGCGRDQDDEATCPMSSEGDSTSSFDARSEDSRDAADSSSPVSYVLRFVPLDLDKPLGQQDSGSFSLIIHKLTEDLLCLTNSKQGSKEYNRSCERISALERYCAQNPSCKLIDSPSRVRHLMSRERIASMLSTSLKSLPSNGAYTVRAPNYAVIKQAETSCRIVASAGLCYPLIAKPLDAAGTVQSHKMTVALSPSGLQDCIYPCLLQSYENHDGVLFKVYVIGKEVRLFRRPSLPNLPLGTGQYKMRSVPFDSQKPYPSLRDFGLYEEGYPSPSPSPSPIPSSSSSSYSSSSSSSYSVPATNAPHSLINLSPPPTLCLEEVLPIASKIKETFHLDLFGFDVLVCTPPKAAPSKPKDLVVVDLNYFPSYKEMQFDLPKLLKDFILQKVNASALP